jgi:hypothetical protein
MRSQVQLILLGLVLSTGLSGCVRNLAGPEWGNPGTGTAQRSRAAIFDPYVDNDLGPEVVGVRPRDFQKPRAEPAKTPLLRDTIWGI